MELKALILAAGKGVRMKSERPKVLFEANGLPLMWYPLTAAREAGSTETIAVVGAGRAAVEDAFRGEGVKFVVQEPQLGTGHAVQCARGEFSGYGGYIFILCGDAPLIKGATLKRLYDHTVARGASCTILTSIVDDPKGYGRIIRGGAEDRGEDWGSGSVERIIEERDATPQQKLVREINSGTYCFRWPDLDAVLGRLSNDNNQKEFLLTDAIAFLIGDGKRVEALASETPEEALGVNSRAQLAVVSRALRMRVLDKWMSEGVTIVDPQSAFIDARARIGVDTTINPFVVIEGPVTIGGKCRIGPFTHIRGECNIGDSVNLGNFVEVKKSTFGDGSRARHLAFVGDTAVGKDVNIAGGVIVANFDGTATQVTHIGDGASVGAGTILVAPTSVAPGGATGAGAVVTKNKTVGAGEVWTGVPARPHK